MKMTDDNFHKNTDGEIVLDRDGEPIPSYICICAAREPFECCCGAWDDEDVESWYRED